jgi:hypothetical protein
MARQVSQYVRRFQGVGALPYLAMLLAAIGWFIQGRAPERNVVFPSELDICRSLPDGALASRGFWVSPTYIAIKSGSLVRYRCTFCNTHVPIVLFLEGEAIVLISDGKP